MDDTTRLAAAAKRDDTTLHLAGDYLHLPEEANHGTHLLLAPGTPKQEHITYERRIGSMLIGVRRGASAAPQAVAEYVIAKPVDWRDIFRRYVDLVGLAEGVTFLHEEDWSPEEWAAIQEVLGSDDAAG